MAPYRFPLEKVLDHKESLKDLQVGKVKEIDGLILQAEEARDRLEAEIENLSRSLRRKQGRELSAAELFGYYRQVNLITGEIDRLTEELRELAQRREAEMEVLLEMHREIKMLETLKEKGLMEYKATELKKEVERIDEANVVKYSRQKR